LDEIDEEIGIVQHPLVTDSPKAVEMLKHHGIVQDTRSTNPVLNDIMEIFDYHHRMDLSHNLVRYRIGNPYHFLQQLCWFIDAQDWLDDKTVINLTPQGKFFQKFMNDLAEEFPGVNIRPLAMEKKEEQSNVISLHERSRRKAI